MPLLGGGTAMGSVFRGWGQKEREILEGGVLGFGRGRKGKEEVKKKRINPLVKKFSGEGCSKSWECPRGLSLSECQDGGERMGSQEKKWTQK